MPNQPTRRRGVLLLVVLSLLVLFVVAGLSFTVLTGTYQRSTVHLRKQELTGDPPQRLLRGAMLQLLRGPNREERSVLQGHDLLGDLYGNDDLQGEIDTAYWGTRTVDTSDPRSFATLDDTFNQFVTLEASTNDDRRIATGHFNGCVLTFTSGSLKGTSTRVVSFLKADSDANGQVKVAITVNRPGTIQQLTDLADVRFHVNGRPNNGTGAGYEDGTGTLGHQATYNLDAVTQVPDPTGTRQGPVTGPTALLPNYMPWSSSNRPDIDAAAGGLDESYDAVDYQNMFLAWQTTAAASGNQIIPTLHRPALINFWRARQATGNLPLENDAELLRKVMLRPNWIDHPNFSGSNPLLDSTRLSEFPAQGGNSPNREFLQRVISGIYRTDPSDPQSLSYSTWDVDNDMDGVSDSIWVDLGFPVQVTPDGRNYKPLFAILCIDLDARLNINAHGSPQHVTGSTYFNPITDVSMAGNAVGTLSVDAADRPMALGFGPADIFLGAMIQDDFNNPAVNPSTDLASQNVLIQERYRSRVDSSTTPGLDAKDDVVPVWTVQVGNESIQSNWKLPGLASRDYFVSTFGIGLVSLNGFGSQPDFQGQQSIVQNHLGQPAVFPATMANALDDPYELNLLSPKVSDWSYTDQDLESVLRANDYDAPVLVPRVKQLISANPDTFTLIRHAATTRSFDVPVANAIAAPFLRGQNDPHPPDPQNPQKLPAIQYGATTWMRNVLTVMNPMMTDSQITSQIQLMVPFELRRGERFDLNRLFGDGLDNDFASGLGYGVIDEPWFDGEGESPIGTVQAGASNPRTQRYDFSNDETVGTQQAPIRQLFARHLYCLLMFLKQPGIEIDFNADGATSPLETATGLAQWAINVVDFRDRDSIMTPFEFDVNPYDGWQVDGNLTTTNEPSRAVVWGCERPELLITETLATHDRRTQDTDREIAPTSGTGPIGKVADGDAEFDQERRPIGSLFIELFNPWQGDTAIPKELCFHWANNSKVFDAGVRLDATVRPNGDPVWRMLVTTAHGDPRDPAAVERAIFFAPSTPQVHAGAERIHQRISTGVAPIVPGRYAVVGPNSSLRANGAYIIPFGLLDGQQPNALDPSDASSLPRRIELTPPSDPNAADAPDEDGVRVKGNVGQGGEVDMPPNDHFKPAVAMVIEEQLDAAGNVVHGSSLSVSEPLLEDYDERALRRVPGANYVPPAQSEYEGKYSQVLDTPLDDLSAALGDDPNDFPIAVQTLGTHVNYRQVHLQRLANPLIAYHPVTNPYLTIDSSWIDLTVFNGLNDTVTALVDDGRPKDPNAEPDPQPPGLQNELQPTTVNPDPMDPRINKKFALRFRSRQRGDGQLPTPQQPFPRTLWQQEGETQIRFFDPNGPVWSERSEREQDWGLPVGRDHYFDFVLSHTLGFSNSGNWPPHADITTPIDNPPPPRSQLGSWGNNRISGDRNNLRSFVGAPDTTEGYPFPWLVWNNRPFANVMELLQVPFRSSSDLLRWFPPNTPGFGFSVSGAVDPYTVNQFTPASGQFAHLLNFLARSASPVNKSPNLVRLFDYVEVPSPFAGTETWLADSSPPTGNPAAYDFTIGFRPPFHRLSGFRRPGSININTMQAGAWQAMMYGNPGATPWDQVLVSRRGYGDTSDPDPLAMDDTIPTRFANPFRATGSADLAPMPAMRVPEVEASLLRSNPANPMMMLFEAAPGSMMERYASSDRNSFHRYHTLQRLGSTVSPHSNCFAVWITVGYFEVSPWKVNGQLTFDDGHPDGWMLGQEIGYDTGTSQRHRAFYIIDRSIPVGYESGKDHNVEDAVVLQRFIE